jgi:hypothetical protein
VTVRSIRDTTGRFPERPFYEERELDQMFERIVVDFLRRRRGTVAFPITTDELTVLIEADVSDLDPYADLTPYGMNVEGMTEFVPGARPRVAIAAALFEQGHRENRHRTTLAHEYGHVKLHAYLFELHPPAHPLLDPRHKPNAIYCKRDTIVVAAKADWMEWQAGYVCGAVLMPRSFVQRLAGEYRQAHAIFGPVRADSRHGQALVEATAAEFQVSREAARVRLERLGVLGEPPALGSLFD